MLTLMPLSGLQSALRRKNSKNYDFSRRGSLSVYSTYSLPTSKNSLRRFSSYEGLAPIFQQFLAQQADAVENSSPVPSPSPSPPPPPPPPVEKRKRRASFSLGKRFRRLSGINLSGESATENSDSNGSNRRCSVDDLDNLFTKIREQLTQLKNEGTEISQRVDDLHSSVGDLYREHNDVERQHMFTTSLTTSLTATLSPTTKVKVSSQSPVSSSPPDSLPLHRQSTTMPSNVSSGSLSVIRESSFEILDDDLPAKDDNSSSDDDEQSFEDYCRANIPKLGVSHAKRQPISFQALDDVDLPAEHFDPKKYCLPNNLKVRPTSHSAPQLQIIRNDLSDSSSSGCDSNQRWSVISVQSDSVLVTSKGPSSHPNRLFEL